MRPDSFNGPEYLPDHPLVGTRWASNNGHYPLRVVMAVARSDGRLRAQLTNHVPGMKTWRLLTDDGQSITGHYQIADADPNVERLSRMFEGIPRLGGGDVAELVAEAIRYPLYDLLPGPGSTNPKAKVKLHREALIALGERL